MLPLRYFLAFGARCAISVQAAVNAQLAIGLGRNVFGAAFYSFATGALVLGIIAVLKGGLLVSLEMIPSQTSWKLIGGVLGAAAIFTTVLLAPRIGLANLLVLVIVGQLLTSLMIDNYGLMNAALQPLTMMKASGAAILLVGALVTLFGDKLLACAISSA